MALSHLSNLLITSFEKKEMGEEVKNGIDVNRIVAEIATWYEKLRNAMDYREKEVARRAAIERILKRRLTFGGDGQKVAKPLIKELLWARYYPDNTITEEDVAKIEKVIDLYLRLGSELIAKHKDSHKNIDSFVSELLSCRIETMLNKNKDIDHISNFIFHLLRSHVTVADDKEETKDIQVFIAVRRAFAKDDIAFLRFHLFTQYFGEVTEEKLHAIVSDFPNGYKEINRQLSYPLKERILAYIKRQIPPFLILGEILRAEREKTRSIILNQEAFKDVVFKTAEIKYKTIASKVRTAIIRAVIFILFTKFIFAFSVEATYDNIFLDGIKWNSLLINIVAPPMLMVIASLFIRTPNRKNTERIYEKVMQILFVEKPPLDKQLNIALHPPKKHPVLEIVFTALWFVAFALSFGAIIYVLNRLHFSIASQGIFIFFVAIISFFTYRISQTAHSYTAAGKEGLVTPLTDFFFMPIVRVGRRLTEGLSQINIFLYLFDYLIETPFKEVFGFLEQWFFFLRTKREELG